MKKYIIVAAMLLSLVAPATIFAQTPADIDPSATSDCTALTSDLRYRSRDVSTNGDVSALQDFLQAKGYLNSEPTGYFGIMTLAAVKSYQKDNGISPTGFVGPLTRARIKADSCGGTVVTPTKPNNNQSNAGCSAGAVYNTVTGALCNNIAQKFTIVTPNGNSVFTMGETYQIKWSGSVSGVEDISLHLIAYKGGRTELLTIGNAKASAGSISWKVPTDLASKGGIGNGYTIELRGKAYSVESAMFSIIAPATTYQPVITRISAKASNDFEAYVGQDLAIEGNYLAGNYISTTNVYLGGIKATVKQASDNLLYIVTPEVTSGTYDLYVSNEKGQSSPVKVKVYGRQVVAPTVSYVQSPAEYQNILHPGERATVYGKNFSGDTTVHMIGKAQENTLTTFNRYSGSVDFTVPYVSDGVYNLSVIQNGVETNKINVNVVATPFTFTFPTANSSLKMGQTYNITWSGVISGTDDISLHLISYKGGRTELLTIGTAKLSAKTISWTVPTDLASRGGIGSGYTIEVRGKAYSSESAVFSVSQ